MPPAVYFHEKGGVSHLQCSFTQFNFTGKRLCYFLSTRPYRHLPRRNIVSLNHNQLSSIGRICQTSYGMRYQNFLLTVQVSCSLPEKRQSNSNRTRYPNTKVNAITFRNLYARNSSAQWKRGPRTKVAAPRSQLITLELLELQSWPWIKDLATQSPSTQAPST